MKYLLLTLLILTLSACNFGPSIDGIEITDQIRLPVGTTHEFKFALDPINADADALIWQSADEDIISIEDGVIEALALGQSEIEIFVEDTLLTRVQVTVVDADVVVEMVGQDERWLILDEERLPEYYHELTKDGHRFLGYFLDEDYQSYYNVHHFIDGFIRLYPKFIDETGDHQLSNDFVGDYQPGEESQLIKVEANPDQGFNFPYYIALPTTEHADENDSFRRHLILESYYYQVVDNDIDRQKSNFETRMLETHGQFVGEALFTPRIIPFIPHVCMVDTSNFEYGKEALANLPDEDVFRAYPRADEMQYILPQSMGYYITNIETAIDDLAVCDRVTGNLAFDHEIEDYIMDFAQIEQQIHAMVEDAQNRLNDSGWELEEEIFINSIEAGAQFAQRYASIYPKQVKALFAGVMQHPLIPASEIDEIELTYPLGVSNYEALFGHSFDLDAYNNIAQMYQTGLNNPIDFLNYLHGYTLLQREALYSLIEEDAFRNQWSDLIELYYQQGGRGLFVTDQYAYTNVNENLNDYIIDFFKLNRLPGGPHYDLTFQDERFSFTLSNDDE